MLSENFYKYVKFFLCMNIKVTAVWDSKTTLEEAHNVYVNLSVGDNSYTFERFLDRGTKLKNYLTAIEWDVKMANKGKEHFRPYFKEKETQNGRAVYVLLDAFSLDSNLNHSLVDSTTFSTKCLPEFDLLHKKYLIVTRNELVTNEEYSTFFNSRFIFGLEDYHKAKRSEHFIQTLYDMEHMNPKIYMWTNNEAAKQVSERINSDLHFAEFYDINIRPILRKMKTASTPSDLEALVKVLCTLPQAQRYDFESEIPLLKNRII